MKNLYLQYMKTSQNSIGFPGGTTGKEPVCQCSRFKRGLIPGLGRSPARVMAAHSSILAWKTPETEEPSGLQSRVRHNSSNLSIAQNSIKTYKKLFIKTARTMDLSGASVVKGLHSMHGV